MKISEFYKDKRVLITGHTGFKGAWMTYMLLDAGAKVTGYALEPPTYPDLFDICKLGERMERHVIGDVRDLEGLKRTFELARPEIVIHMAAQPIVRKSYEEPVYTYDVNVMGTVNVLECCRLSDTVRSVINVTTDKVYRNDDEDAALRTTGFKEDEELNGYDPYSNSKSCSELVTSSYIKSFLKDRNIAVSTVRAGNVIGGGDFAKDRIIPDCIRAVDECEDIIVRNPYSIRPYQHVLEPVSVYLMIAMEQFDDPGKAGCYNVGPDETDCLNTGALTDMFCKMWLEKTGNEPKWINEHDGGPHEAGYLKLDCTKLKETFGWEPKWNISIAMQKLVDWYAAYLNKVDVEPCMKEQIREFL